MRNEENICQYCTKQRAITTLLLNVDVPDTYTYMFWVSVNSNILYIPPSFLAFYIPLIFAL